MKNHLTTPIDFELGVPSQYAEASFYHLSESAQPNSMLQNVREVEQASQNGKVYFKGQVAEEMARSFIDHADQFSGDAVLPAISIQQPGYKLMRDPNDETKAVGVITLDDLNETAEKLRQPPRNALKLAGVFKNFKRQHYDKLAPGLREALYFDKHHNPIGIRISHIDVVKSAIHSHKLRMDFNKSSRELLERHAKIVKNAQKQGLVTTHSI